MRNCAEENQKRMKRSGISILLTVLMCILLTLPAMAADQEEEGKTVTAVVSGETQTVASSGYYTDINQATQYVRDQMVARKNTIVVNYATTSSDMRAPYNTILAGIKEHTGVAVEGDYLLNHMKSWIVNMSSTCKNGTYYNTYTFTVEYRSTAAQETAVTAKVKTVLAGVDYSNMSNYEKVKYIYNYLTTNVTYDYDHLNDSSYVTCYTAYAALCQNTAVCQGYALAFYRLALEMGVDARFVSGTADGGAHGWNIVQMDDGNYYFADATWDAPYVAIGQSYRYFLKGTGDMSNHIVDTSDENMQWYSSYKIATSEYKNYVTAVTFANTKTGIQLKWNAVSGATSYILYRKTSSSASWKKYSLSYTQSGNVLTALDTSVTDGTTYYYTIVCIINGSRTPYVKAGFSYTYLAKPATPTLTNAASGMKITWTQAKSATKYAIYRRAEGDTSSTRIATITSGSTVTYTDKTASNNVKYKYCVRAYCGSSYSVISSWTALTMRVARVEIKTLTNTKGGIVVAWGKVSGATQYVVYRKAAGATSWTRYKVVSSTTYIVDTNVTSGTKYTYTVRAVNNGTYGYAAASKYLYR